MNEENQWDRVVDADKIKVLWNHLCWRMYQKH